MSQIRSQKSLRSQIYESVREDLRQGRISHGGLLVERNLAEALGVSRTPVREALLALEQDGFLHSTPRGFRPRRLDDTEITHIFEMRQLLEPQAIANAASTGGRSLHLALTVALEEQRVAHAAGDVDVFMQANQAFRRTWRDRLVNPRLEAAVALYDDHIHAMRLATLNCPLARQMVIESLELVVDAISTGNITSIKSRYEQHLKKAEGVLREGA